MKTAPRETLLVKKSFYTFFLPSLLSCLGLALGGWPTAFSWATPSARWGCRPSASASRSICCSPLVTVQGFGYL